MAAKRQVKRRKSRACVSRENWHRRFYDVRRQGTLYASFIGIVPAETPRYVILVGVMDPRGNGTGGAVAAPVFAKIAARALGAR